MRKPFFFAYAKTKPQISCAVTAQVISAFVFHYMDSTILLLFKSEISSLQPSSVAAQPGLCQTWSETQRRVFSQRGSYILVSSAMSAGEKQNYT